jgi:hypothetical protein
MEKQNEDSDLPGIDVAAYAEIDVPTPAPDSEARLALYEVQRERGADPEEPMETLLQAKLADEGRILDVDRGPVDVAAYAEIDVPTPAPDSEARIALRAVQRERGGELSEVEGQDAA